MRALRAGTIVATVLSVMSCAFSAGCFISIEDAHCPDGAKRCGDECVSKSDPAHGCSAESCDPLPTCGEVLGTPAPPRPCVVPESALRVTDGGALLAALAEEMPRDIVLADGTYDAAAPFDATVGHRLWTERVGGATLTAGIEFGSNYGGGAGLVCGVHFDVTDPALAPNDALVSTWGVGAGLRVLDCTLEGNGTVGIGVRAFQPDGLVIERTVVHGLSGRGVVLHENEPSAVAARLEDVDVAEVMSSDGSGLCLEVTGHSPISVNRFRARACGTSAIFAGGDFADASFADLDLDGADTGVYLGQTSRNTTFENFRMGPALEVGFSAEWDHGVAGAAGSIGNTMEHGVIESSFVGVVLDFGTDDTTIRDVTFVGQCWAAIADNTTDTGNGGDPGENVYDGEGNDYRGIDPGAVPVRFENVNMADCQ